MSDDLRKYAEENRILEIMAGSHLYGTSTPESDEDYVGIFLPPKEYVFGLKSVKEVDLGIQDKGEDGKNTADAVDKKLYELRKFMTLALSNNPNIIEILFVPDGSIVHMEDAGGKLLDAKGLFPSQQCIPKFIGYAHSQKHKMIIRRDHFNELRNAYGFLMLLEDKLTMGQVYDRQKELAAKDVTFTKKETGAHIHVGDLNFEPGVYVKKARKILKERLDKATNRSELVLKHGYDTKFASHLIRLLYEGLFLLEYKELVFPLPMASLILDVKAGKYEVQQIIEMADKLEDKLRNAQGKTKLPKTSNYKKIEELTISIMTEHLLSN